MPSFTVRIELHGAKPEDYTALHGRMENGGYKRYVNGTSSKGEPGTWVLPTAEYDISCEATAADVRDHAKAIADTVRSGSWCLVTEVANRSWSTKQLQAA